MAKVSEVHITVQNSQIHNPGVSVLPVSAGQPISVAKSADGKTIASHGQVSGTSIIHNNPA